MTRAFRAALAITLILIANTANARPRHNQTHNQGIEQCDNSGRCVHTSQSVNRVVTQTLSAHGDPRPSRWCGWQARQWLGVTDRRFNLAREWVHYGSPAGGPAPGVVAVWPHHVGIVVAVPAPGKIILKSGNDGHAVRTRERSTRGVIAWRSP